MKEVSDKSLFIDSYKKKLIKSFMILMLFIFLVPSFGFAETKNVYIIDAKGEVNVGMLNYIRSSINDANDNNADLILIEVDTLGGRVDSAEAISREILRSEVKTASYVNTKAESAGVLISISANSFYMAPASTIGSAETIPNTEKALSYWTSLLKTTAEQRGKDPQIVAAMADASVKIEGLVEEGKLLNLTTRQAEELGFSDGTMESRQQIYEDLELGNVNEIVSEKSFADTIAGFISSSFISQLLLTAGFIGIVIEVITPGFGIGGLISILGFSLFFAGSILSGSTSTFAIIIFALGIILLLIEVFVPGFGIFGVSGIGAIFASIIMASDSIYQALISISISSIVTAIVIALIIKYLPKRNLSRTLFLGTNLDKEGGFVSSKEETDYIGKEGIALTFLRPSGKIEINGLMLDAISQGRYIEKDKTVVVLKVEGSRLIVKEKEGVL